jgi:hypothetical protein
MHHVTSMNGTSGWEPPMHQRIRARIEAGNLDAGLTRTIEHYGAKIVVLHPDQMGPQRKPTLQWAESEVAAGRLEFVRRFDNGMSGDWVLAVTKNLPEWPRFVDNARDAAGFRQGESFQRMLRGETTYNGSTFGRVELPKPYDPNTGPLQISGWALSPNGIRQINVLVHGGAKRYPATMFSRPDVSSVFPWYPNVPQPGFIVRLNKRPKGIPRQTDVQAEIVDGAGRVTRLPDVPIYWD